MADEKKQEKSPADERAEIGTPAGESPEKGRRRHGTECLSGVCRPAGEVEPRKVVDEEITEDELQTGEEELSTTGGITGTHERHGLRKSTRAPGKGPVGPAPEEVPQEGE